MFSIFERLLKPAIAPERPQPPATLIAFYWHYARQAKGLFIALFAAGFAVAVLDILIPVFMGRVVALVTSSDPQSLFRDSWHVLAGMAAVLVLERADTTPTARAWLRGVNDAKFRRQVVPGDRLRLDVRVGRMRSRLAKVHAMAFIADQPVAEAELVIGIERHAIQIDRKSTRLNSSHT